MKLFGESFVIPKLAVRNLVLSKRRSVLLGSLIVLGVVIAVVGNSFFESAGVGLKRTFVDCFTGDLFLGPKADERLSLFGVDTPVIGSYVPIPVLLHHDEVLEAIQEQPGVAAAISQISGYALLEAWGTRNPIVLFGVNGDSYFPAFPAVRISSGSRLRTGVPGVMIARRKAEKIAQADGRPLAIGDPILLSVFTKHGFAIREVPLAATFEYPVQNSALERIAYVDADTIRALNGMVLSKVDLRDLPPESTNFLESDLTGVFDSPAAVRAEDHGISVADVERTLAQTGTQGAGAMVDAGSWNFVLIKLKPRIDAAVFRRSLEDRLRVLGLEARVDDWRAAAGSGAALAGSLSVAFNVGLVLLSIVIVLILANIFYTWVIERTSEIATMRALGASKGFVVSLFLAESLILSTASAAFGLIIGSLLVLGLNRRGFPTDNRILVLIFGGAVLRPLLTLRALVGGLLGAIVVGAAAILMPLRMTLRLRPARALDVE